LFEKYFYLCLPHNLKNENMKNTFKILILLLLATGLVLSSCKKDDKSDKDKKETPPPISENQKAANLIEGKWYLVKVDGVAVDEGRTTWTFNSCKVSTSKRCTGITTTTDPDKGPVTFQTSWTVVENGKKLDLALELPGFPLETTLYDIKVLSEKKMVIYDPSMETEEEYIKK